MHEVLCQIVFTEEETEMKGGKKGRKDDIAIDSILWQYIQKHVLLQNSDLGDNVIITSFKTFHPEMDHIFRSLPLNDYNYSL